jgi:hypothetical protein
MENNPFETSQYQDKDLSVSKSFMSSVFSWMFIALLISAIMAYAFSQSEELLKLLINFETGKLNIFGYVTLFAPLLFVMAIGMGFNRFSYPVILILFLAFATINGISLSFIFLAYNLGTIYTTFGIAAVTFGVMAVAGYTTKKDLTGFGSIMFMGLIGIIIASVVNFFLHSSQMDYIISFIGVLVFTGLTAYDVQKLKVIGSGVAFEEKQTANKLAIMGALNLYLDFINLFLFLLRIFGRRK